MKPSTKKRSRKGHSPLMLKLLLVILLAMLVIPAYVLYAIFKSELVMGCYVVGVLAGGLWAMLLDYMDKNGWF